MIVVQELCKEFKSASKSTSQLPAGKQWIDTDYAGPATVQEKIENEKCLKHI